MEGEIEEAVRSGEERESGGQWEEGSGVHAHIHTVR